MSEREVVRVLRDPPGELVNDLGYDSLGFFVLKGLHEGWSDQCVRPAGVRGPGPADCPLDLCQVGRHDRDRRVVFAGVRGHGTSRSGRSAEVKADDVPSAWEAGVFGGGSRADLGERTSAGFGRLGAFTVFPRCSPLVLVRLWCVRCGYPARTAFAHRRVGSPLPPTVRQFVRPKVSSYGPRPCRAVSATTSTRCSVKDSSMEAHSSSRSPVS